MTHSPSGYDAAHRPGGLAAWRRSPLGLLELRGADRHSFLQGMVSNDVAALAPGDACHAALLDTTGHVLADLRVLAFPESLVVETSAACFLTLHQTLDKFLIMEDVTLVDVSDQWVVLSVLGDGAADLGVIPAKRCPLSFPLVPGYDLWFRPDAAPSVSDALSKAGAVTLSDSDAEVMRVEAGIPAWGHELSPSILLPETGMDDAVSYTKGCYVGQEIVARLHARGHANRSLRHVLMSQEAPVPPPGATLHVPEDGPEPGREIGRVTSAVSSPMLGGRALALAYVRKEYWEPGTPISVQIDQPGGLAFAFSGEVREQPGKA